MATGREYFWNIASGLVVTSAVVTSALALRREFAASRPAQSAQIGGPEVDDWGDMAASGARIGPAEATLQIVVFSDFECRACRAFATRTLPGVLAEFAGSVSVTFHHWPLEYHRFAIPAAVAAECAGDQGRFWQMHDALFRHQDSLGLRSFVDFAREAQVENLDRFVECSADPSKKMEKIREDERTAFKIGGTGTPTIVVNGRRLISAPDSSRFDSYLRSLVDE